MPEVESLLDWESDAGCRLPLVQPTGRTDAYSTAGLGHRYYTVAKRRLPPGRVGSLAAEAQVIGDAEDHRMRLWTVHPKYLDSVGLVALWREVLLARAVLGGETVGYRHHPQLTRFRAHPQPIGALNRYLDAVYAGAVRRGYAFDPRKLGRAGSRQLISERPGQLAFEWARLLKKLRARRPLRFQELIGMHRPAAHPLFRIVPGPVRPWERGVA